MKENNEITLRVNGSMTDFKNKLIAKGYIEASNFKLNDTYMVLKSLDLKETSIRDILKDAVIIRDINDVSEKIKRVTYKIKDINEKGEILS